MIPVPKGRGRWRLTLHNRQFTPTTWGETLIAELTGARSRKLIQVLDTSAQLTFTMDGRTEEAALLAELTQDVVAWRWSEWSGRDVPYFRGIISHSEDDISEDDHTVVITCNDYLAMLMRRFNAEVLTWPFPYEQDVLSAAFLNEAVNAQSSSGSGSVSFSPASYLPLAFAPRNPDGTERGPTGITIAATYPAASTLGTLLDNLAHSQNGFDYDVVPGWRFDGDPTQDLLRIFFPQQGVDLSSQLVLEYGGSISKVTRQVDSGTYANYEKEIGSNASGTPIYSEAWNSDALSETVGLWQNIDNSSTQTLQAGLDAAAAGQLALLGTFTPTYAATFRPGFFTDGLVKIGDTVPFILKSGRLDLAAAQRVMGLEFDIGDDGQEDVILTLGRSVSKLTDEIHAQTLAIDQLARR